MRIRLLITALLLAGAFATTHCSAQAEESTEDMTDEELATQALFFQLGLIDLGGIYWEGDASINTCIGTTIDASLYCGTIIAQGQQIQQDTINKNYRMIYTSQGGSSVTSTNWIMMPHFNGYPFGYEVLMSGTLSATQNNADYQVDFTQTSVSVNPNTGYDINISAFTAEKTEGDLEGSFTVTLSNAAINGDAILQYNVSASRSY